MTRRLSIERTVTKALDMKVWWFVYSQTSDYALTLQLFCTQPS